MDWDIKEALSYYKKMGAPKDQHMLVELLKEIQDNNNNSLSPDVLKEVCETYNIKETFLLAVVKRIPRLRLSNKHKLVICNGVNCKKSEDFISFIENKYGKNNDIFELSYIPCMKMCKMGPNIKWDGKVYNKVTKKFISSLIEENVKNT